MSRFTKPSINWAEMEKLVPPDQKHKFMAFKGKADNYLRRVLSNPAEPPAIDWATYKKIVPVPGLVDKFESEYKSYKVPYPTDNLSKEVDAQWSKLQNEIKTFVATQQKDIQTASEELKRIRALPSFESMTMETFYDMYERERLDPVNNPTFWPHNAEEQLGYEPPVIKSGEKK